MTNYPHLRLIMLKTNFKLIVLLISINLFYSNAFALNATDVPEKKRTKLALYFNSIEAESFMETNGKFALFLDVRDPHELQTTGMADAVDYNVPFNFININKWDEDKNRFKFDLNPDFIKDVKKRYMAKGLSGFDAIVVICTAGTRAAKAANALFDNGFKNVHTVVDGFRGWKRNDLNWSNKLDRSKMYNRVASGK